VLSIALKEWNVVCDLLLEGKLALLLRKGGIHERGGPGVFELEHPRFLLFPSWAHQKPEMIKPAVRPRVQLLSEPSEITFRGVGEAVKIWDVNDRTRFAPGSEIDELHCWTPAQIDMRFNYKPENPLYLMAVRVYSLATPKTVPNLPAYAGCKSWVPLQAEHVVDGAGAKPVLDDAAFDALLARVQRALRG